MSMQVLLVVLQVNQRPQNFFSLSQASPAFCSTTQVPSLLVGVVRRHLAPSTQ